MKSNELSALVQQVVEVAQSRITGVGKQQYEEQGNQKFESMSIPDLLEYMEEELLDQINYAVMNYLRIHNMKLEVLKMQAGMRNAGLIESPPARDLQQGYEFRRKTFVTVKNEVGEQVTTEIDISDKKLNLA